MTRPSFLDAVRLAAVGLVLAGLLACAWSAARTPDRRRILAAKIGDLEDVEREAERVERFAPLWAALEATPKGPLPAPARIWAAADAPGAPEVTMREPVPLKEGWAARRAEVVTGELPAASIFRFVEACESNRPPWRAVELQLEAVDPGGGRVRARILLEGLERTGAS
jgi:hypothetical protein